MSSLIEEFKKHIIMIHDLKVLIDNVGSGLATKQEKELFVVKNKARGFAQACKMILIKYKDSVVVAKGGLYFEIEAVVELAKKEGLLDEEDE